MNQFRENKAGKYPISKEFARLLRAAQALRELTRGGYNPAVGTLLEKAGYDKNYRFKEEQTANIELTGWRLDEDDALRIDGPISFDLGGIGKGYAIDRVADIIRGQGFPYYIVEAGGDMVATEKRDGASYSVAIEWPGNPEMAVGLVYLKNKGLAVSDSFKRRWGKWHHIVDVHKNLPVDTVVGAAALSRDAWSADQMTSGLFLAEPVDYIQLQKNFDAGYLVFLSDGTLHASENWGGEFFAE